VAPHAELLRPRGFAKAASLLAPPAGCIYDHFPQQKAFPLGADGRPFDDGSKTTDKLDRAVFSAHEVNPPGWEAGS
jgi:hypothetical protein